LAAFIVSAGWFVALTLVWPTSSRPYIAGSTDNNFMNLVLGYNGFARVLGRNHPGAGNGPAIGSGVSAHVAMGPEHRGGFGEQAQGLPRLFSGEFGFEIGWLLPAALLAMVLVIIARGRAPRTDLVRAGAILFGGWMLVDGLVLSFMQSMVHPYYCLSLAPAVGGMFAIGVHEMWRQRSSRFGRIGLAAIILVTGVWGWWLLGRNGDWLPPLRWTILGLTITATVALVISLASRSRQRLAVAALILGVLSALAGPAAYAFATIGTSHAGGNAMVGPARSAQAGHGGADRAGGAMGGQDVDNAQLDALLQATNTDWSAAIDRSSTAAGLELSTNTAVMAIGGFSGSDPVPTLSQFQTYVSNHQVTYYIVPNGDNNGRFGNQQHSDISTWVTANFKGIKLGSDTVYDVTAPKAS
jgi:4-amino-4-deoxy-L-arabinose transferase-like glycosyltransferase